MNDGDDSDTRCCKITRYDANICWFEPQKLWKEMKLITKADVTDTTAVYTPQIDYRHDRRVHISTTVVPRYYGH